MKQIIQSYRTGELWLADVPAPAPRAGGVVVQTAASLVSAGTERMIIELAKKSLLGKARARPDLVRKVISKVKTEGLSTTLEKVFAKLDTPIPLGYSCAGIARGVGSGVSNIKAGDRVACGGAGYATHAEYNYIPKNLLVAIPDSVSFEDASFATVGAIAMQGVRQADVRIGERVVVIGLGLIGLLTVQILKAAGCKVLGSDPDARRCQLAIDLGADVAVKEGLLEAAAAFSDGHGADATLITAATESNVPIEEAAEIARVKGKVVIVGVVGMDVPRDPFYKKELDLRLSMSYGPGRYDTGYEVDGHDYPIGYIRWTEQRNMSSFIDLVAANKIMPAAIITHRYCIDDALAAYSLLETNSEPYLGVVISYPDAERVTPPSRVTELKAITATPQIGIGFIGAGNFASSVLIPTLKKLGGVTLVGVCTATGMSAAQTAKKHEFAYATTDTQRLLSDPKINTVVIATRHDTHASFAIAAMKAGKHVFVEKPLCVRPDEVESVIDAVTAARGRCFMVGFNRRFSPHTRAIRDAFADRKTPMFITYRVNAGLVPRDSWLHDESTGGGRIIGEMCHFIDWCEHVVGSPVTSAQAMSITTDDVRLKSEDSVAATLRYADGSVATIQYVALGSTSLSKERAEVFADGSAAVLDDYVTTTFHGLRRSPIKTKQDKGFTGEFTGFLNAIRQGGPAPIELASLIRTTRATFAILESLRSGTAQPIQGMR